MQTIEDIIKRAVDEAGLKPSNTEKKSNGAVKSASDQGGMSGRLYDLADKLEKMGDVQIGVTPVKRAGDNTLNQLAKTFIYQQTLKQASEDRMGVHCDAGIEKLAAHVGANAAYLDAFKKKANVRVTARYPKDVDPDEVMRAGKKNTIGVSSGLGAGAVGGILGAYHVGKRIRNPLLATLAGGASALTGMVSGMAVGGRATKIPKRLRHIGEEKIEETDSNPHKTIWKQYPKYQEASIVLGQASEDRMDVHKKKAYMKLEDVENHMGGYLPDKDEVGVRELLADRKANSFILRHPWLTGIPTLGIAPAIAHDRAMTEISSKVLRKNPALATKMRNERLEEFRLNTERSKAEQAERMAGVVMSGLANIAGRVI